jgi:hypothetical protein
VFSDSLFIGLAPKLGQSQKLKHTKQRYKEMYEYPKIWHFEV